jgi:predicted nucleic acid-binding protein
MILVDSSIWIDYFRRGQKSKTLSQLIEQDLVITNEIILSELIPVLVHQKQKTVVDSLLALEVKKNEIFWDGIRSLQILNLKNGINKVGIPDLIIVQQCLEQNIELWSFDQHFELISSFVELKLFIS